MSLLYCELFDKEISKAGFINKNYPIQDLMISDKNWTPKKEKILKNNLKNIFTYRAKLVKWLHSLVIFDISYASISNAIEIIDMFLSNNFVHDSQIKLLAITALVLSSKYYDDNSLEPLFIHNMCNEYPVEDLIEAERELLIFLDWKISQVTPYTYISNLDITDDIREVSLMIYERFSIRKSFVDQSPVDISIVCVFFAHRLLGEISNNSYLYAFISILLPNGPTLEWFKHLL